jgi:hypothetical protein
MDSAETKRLRKIRKLERENELLRTELAVLKKLSASVPEKK